MTTAPGRPRPASPPLPPARPPAETTAVKLSVVVPVYNERYLVRDLLARVLAVEDPCLAELEVVVVDDGSTDGSREILRQLAAEEPRLHYFEHSHNQGKGAAIRTGIAAATGDLTLFQDARASCGPSSRTAPTWSTARDFSPPAAGGCCTTATRGSIGSSPG